MTNHNGDVPAPQPTGLRAQLHHLLPRHALFHVRITINQLASVPLVHGEFGVRWKFKNTQKVKGKGKAKAAPEPEHDDGDSLGSADTSIEEPQSLQIPSHPSASSSTMGADAQTNTSRAGQTGWLPLKDHSVTWDQPLSAVVQMSIERDTHRLLPHPFKLIVLQRVIAHDPDAPHNPRLGTVEIDLAEYVDSVPPTSPSKGVVTRRYLLRDSKTNATLRLSVRVEPVGTPTPFTAPPLPNGEILAGVATLLSTHDDVYRTRPRALDLYAPVESSLQSSKASIKSAKSNGTSEIQSFDIRALPRAYGPRPTESLIEALFNPAPVRDERLVGPFTKLVSTESGSVTSFPSSPLSNLYSTSFTSTTTSSRPSTSASASSRSIAVSAENSSPSSAPVSPPPSVAPSTSGSLAPSNKTSASGHNPRPSISASISPSFVIPQRTDSPTPSADGRSHHWWRRNRDRSRSRSRARTGAVAVA
ncbi:N-terminal C2 in EEIG1 and EHBP1 proteins-domain-containing protein [Mycena olivaceomarginata]|nr:N-terminal C2 in EEIG1 and EHBP1 proteins-domain-containing protein [Mycena olivaceomarginata]